jgi:energy-coupling factor transporter ATP-binding protein EcfA2
MTRPLFEGVLACLAWLLLVALLTASMPRWLHPDVWPMTTLLALLWMLWRSLLLERAMRTAWAWQHNVPWHGTPAVLQRLTAAADPGALTLGLAFPWTAVHTQVLETALHRQKVLPTATDALGGVPALHAVGQRAERPLRLPFSERGHHTLVTGTTGSGKTVLLEVLARDAIHGPGAVMLLDMKFSRELLARCAAEARAAGKPFRAFLPAFPAASVSFNVLATARDAGEVAERIRALMPSAGGRVTDPFFEEFPLGIIENIAQAQQALGQPWTLPGIFRATMIRTHLAQLIAAYLTRLGVTSPRRSLPALIGAYRASRLGDMLADSLIEDYEWPGEHYRKVTAMLVPTFRGVIRPPLAPLLGAVRPDITWGDISAASIVVYVGLPSLRYRTTAHRIGRALIQDLLGFLGTRQAYEDCTQATPVTLLIDELRQVLYPGVVDALAMVRSAGGALILAQQAMADAEYALGKPGAKVLRANVNTKIWCRLGDDDESGTVATEGIGTCVVQLPRERVGIGYGGVGGLTGNAGRDMENREVPLFKPQWLPALPIGHALVRMQGELWKLRVPLLPPVPATAHATLGLEALWESAPHLATGAVEDEVPDVEEGGAVPALDVDPDAEGEDPCVEE